MIIVKLFKGGSSNNCITCKNYTVDSKSIEIAYILWNNYCLL